MLSRALSAQAVLVLMVGCTLDPRVQYLCEPDGTCIQPGRVCRDDPDGNRYCVIPDGSGGGSPTGGGSTGGGMTGGGMTGGGMTGGGMTGGGMTGGGTGGGTTGGGTGGGGPSCACLPTDGCGFKPGCGDTFCDYCSPGTQCGVTVPNQCARVNLCEPDGGWCWENPLPQGNDLRGVFHQSARRTFIVGDAATVMFFDGERLSLMPTELPRTAQLNAVHGNATRVYAVGDDGVIAALEGDRWVQENSGTTSDLYSVFVFPDGTAYAAGARATVRKREPGPCPGAAICWNEVGTEAAPSIDFGPISGDPSTLDVRLATRGGPSIYVLRFGQFRLESTFSGLEFRALTFVEGRSWAGVTRANFVLTLDGGFDGPTRQVGIPFNAGSAVVPGGDEAALYLAGVNGRILRVPLDGGPTDDIDTRFGQELYAIDLIGPRHVMAVGDDGSWVACLPPCTDLSHARELTTLDFRGVSHLCGLDDTTMFAATQALCDARTCTLRASRRETSTAARWVYLDNRVFDGGSPLPDGGARVRDGAGCALDEPSRRAFHLDVTGNYLSHSFNTVGSNATSAGRFADLDGGILGVWSATDVAFLLTPGAIVEGRWSDGSIAGIGAFDAGGPRALSGIIRRGNADVYAVGESGFAYRATDAGQPAAKLTSGNRATMTAVYGTVRPDGGGLWVAGGEGGAIWRRTHLGNETFTVEDAGFTEDIRTAYLSPSGQAFLRVPQGQLLTGFPYLGQWTLMPVPVSDELRALTGVPMADGGLALYSGGSQGKILRLETGLPYARP